MPIKRGNEYPTIDVTMVTIKELNNPSAAEYIIDTANKLGVNVQSEQQDAIKLVIKNRLIAQKHEEITITGHTLVLTDNVFTPEVVKILQGGTIEYWTSAEHTEKAASDAGFGVAHYTPPVAGSTEKGKLFELNAYSAIYNAAGIVTGYEKITYPNCKGTPVALSSEDNVFRASEYTIYSSPDTGEAPYDINYVDPDELPVETP